MLSCATRGGHPKTVIFDSGERQADETHQWQVVAKAAGISCIALAEAIGAVIERDLDHGATFADLGILRILADDAGYMGDILDFYPDAIAAPTMLKADGYRVGIVANQPEGVVGRLNELDLRLDMVGSSATYGAAKPDPRFFQRITVDCGMPAQHTSSMSATASTVTSSSCSLGLTDAVDLSCSRAGVLLGPSTNQQ